MCFIFTCLGRWTGLGGCFQELNTNKDQKWLDSIVKKRYCTDVPFLVLLCAVLSVPVLFLYKSIAAGVNLDYLLKGVDYEGRLCDEDNPDGSYGVLPDIRNFQVMVCVHDCDQTLNDTRFLWNYKTRPLVKRFCIPDIQWIREIGLVADDMWDEYSQHGLDVARAVQRLFADVLNMKEVIIGCCCFSVVISFAYGYFIGKMGRCLVWTAIVFSIIAGALISAGLIITSDFVKGYGFPRLSTCVYALGVICAIFTTLMFFACIFLRSQINLAIELLKQTSLALTELTSLFLIPMYTLILAIVYLFFWFTTLIYMLAVWDEKIEPVPGSPDAAEEGWLCPGPGVVVNGINCLRPQDLLYNPNLLECCSSVALDKPEKCCTSLYKTLKVVSYTNLHLNNVTRSMLLLHGFILLWFIQFLIYWTYMILCGAFSEWYFAAWKDTDHRKKLRSDTESGAMSTKPVWSAFWRATRYHMGTIAMGALIIAIIQFIQYVLMYLETQCSKDDAGAITKVVLKCVICCLRVLECIFDRVSKNGFIVCSITGLPFCISSWRAIRLMCSNIMRTAALTMVSKYIEILGQICIMSFSTALCVFILQHYYKADTLSVLMPMAVILDGLSSGN